MSTCSPQAAVPWQLRSWAATIQQLGAGSYDLNFMGCQILKFSEFYVIIYIESEGEIKNFPLNNRAVTNTIAHSADRHIPLETGQQTIVTKRNMSLLSVFSTGHGDIVTENNC